MHFCIYLPELVRINKPLRSFPNISQIILLLMSMTYSVAERFMRYVQIDTQSDASSSTFPSTEKQKDLSRLLVQELQEMGIQDAELDEYGYV